ncbi:hypothetical protein [Latilactobacillus sakei]|uniref:hypothetical protein n=1 Tax=Latilactobacillus sakei TaxID=1599 RepID=UPI0015F63BC3|nr:hypothetical protein [Latilactobacillus sakei]MCP8854540.1 hypothetical protein [Latilactobacillus sakei]QMU86519.1 hypothetical protein H3M14_00570 [Latilactobacillus sakei]
MMKRLWITSYVNQTNYRKVKWGMIELTVVLAAALIVSTYFAIRVYQDFNSFTTITMN